MIRLLLLNISAVLFFTTNALGQAPHGLADSQIQELESEIKKTMEAQRIPGLSVAIVTDRNSAWSKGFGLSDIENNVPATSKTCYRLASISKSVTAVAAMQLVEQGKLELDAPVQKYVPDFPEKRWPITGRQLLGHLSGIRHYPTDMPGRQRELMSTQHYMRIKDGLRMFQDDPLLHQPGEKFTYTTHGYTLLGCIIESASGMSFMDYLKKHITQPAGMETLRDDNVRAIIPNRAQGYRRTIIGQLQNSTLVDTSYKIPGGGLCGTVEDLAKFAVAVQSDKILKPATRKEMWTVLELNSGEKTSYALGWGIGKYKDYQSVSHSGAQQRVRTILYMVPEAGFAVALMCNLERVQLDGIVKQIADVVVEQ